MRRYGFPLIGLLLFFACGEPEPRRPIQARSGSFIKESVARSKKILEQEQNQIQEVMRMDSLHSYLTSPFGFWYYYEVSCCTS